MEIEAVEKGAGSCWTSIGGQEKGVLDPRIGLYERNAVVPREEGAPPA